MRNAVHRKVIPGTFALPHTKIGYRWSFHICSWLFRHRQMGIVHRGSATARRACDLTRRPRAETAPQHIKPHMYMLVYSRLRLHAVPCGTPTYFAICNLRWPAAKSNGCTAICCPTAEIDCKFIGTFTTRKGCLSAAHVGQGRGRCGRSISYLRALYRSKLCQQ